MSEFGQAKSLEQWRQVHGEPAPIPLAKSAPAADRIVRRSSKRFDGARRSLLILVGGAKQDPVPLSEEPRMEVVDCPGEW